MSIINLQDLNAIIHNTSRYGLPYDLIHIETILVMNEPIPQDKLWYVPTGNAVPPVVQELLKIHNLEIYPMSEESILKGTEDIREQAQAGNLEDVMLDSSKLILRSIMTRTNINPIPGTSNMYLVSYDYKLYPISDNVFEFRVVMPFDGLTLNPSGGEVRVTVIAPNGSQIDVNETKGIPEGQLPEIQELVQHQTNVNKPIISFQYKLDPKFIVRYHY